EAPGAEGGSIAGSAASEDQPRTHFTCVEIARQLYHYKSCGKDWYWLHKAMQPDQIHNNSFVQDQDKQNPLPMPRSHERYGTILALLFRDAIDNTLLARDFENQPHLCPHESDVVLPLS